MGLTYQYCDCHQAYTFQYVAFNLRITKKSLGTEIMSSSSKKGGGGKITLGMLKGNNVVDYVCVTAFILHIYNHLYVLL